MNVSKHLNKHLNKHLKLERIAGILMCLTVLTGCSKAHVTGRVFEDEQTALRNALVQIQSKDAGEKDSDGNPAQCLAQTNAVGRFSCTRLENRRGTMRFRKNVEYAIEITRLGNKPYEGNFTYSPSTELLYVMPKSSSAETPTSRETTPRQNVRDIHTDTRQ